MKDIAQKLGVSTALVSYVLNNQLVDRINKETAEKIRQLAREMDYQPNYIAKSLKSKKTNTIGLIVSDISNPFSGNIARIIEDEAKKINYTVIFGSADESYKKSQDLINVLLSRQVDGFIIAPAEGSEKQLMLLKQQAVPFVLIDRYFPKLEADQVIINNYKAAYQAVAHLIANGFHRIGMINFNTGLFHLQERVRGYKQALIDADIKPNDAYFKAVAERDIKVEVGLAIDELLETEEPIEALFFGSNHVAIAGLAHIQRLKIKVPEELAIVCFDEDNAYNLFNCPITYVKQPLAEIGMKAVENLLIAINEGSKHKSTVLNATLMVNSSSAASTKRLEKDKATLS